MIDEALEVVEGVLRFILTIPGMIASVLGIIVLSIVGGALLNEAFEVSKTAFENNILAQQAITAAQTTTEVVGTFDDSKAIYKVILPSIVAIAGVFGFRYGLLSEAWHGIPIGVIAVILFVVI